MIHSRIAARVNQKGGKFPWHCSQADRQAASNASSRQR